MIKTNKGNFTVNFIFAIFSIILISCSQPTSTPVVPPVTSPTTPSGPTQPTSPATPGTESTEPENPSAPVQRIVMILPQNTDRNFAINYWETINFTGTGVDEWSRNFTSSSDCEIEIMDQGNESDINLQAMIHTDRVYVKADKAGNISFRVKNRTKNIVSNYLMLIFSDNSQNTNNQGSQFYGTWKTSFSQGLIDTIEFYSNGTGRYSNSRYPSAGSDTFSWSVRNSTTLNITNSLNQDSTCTYSFASGSLILKNFFGLPQNTEITFRKL